MFKEYQHIERFSADETEGIELGTTHVFPKIDGTNASIWYGDDSSWNEFKINCGSRSRIISIQNDNQGFAKYVFANIHKFVAYFEKNPHHRLFAEFLVPHTLKTYRDSAWNKPYVFDVTVGNEESFEYLPYERYVPLLEEVGIDYIQLLATGKNIKYEQLIDLLEKNTFLIEDGRGVGEGIVIKNYDYRNKYGRQTWAKIVRTEFREEHVRAMGGSVIGGGIIEEELASKFCTDEFVKKEYAKIVADKGGWSSKYIPELLGRVYHEFVAENIWAMIKHKKNLVINFNVLQRMVIARIKQALPEVF